MARKPIRWDELTLLDDDTLVTYDSSPEQYLAALREYRETGCMHGLFFDPPTDAGIADEDLWSYTPEIDWTGFPD